MQKKVFIKSYGCQMNEYDATKMADLLAASHNFISTSDPNKAELIILNTCSVREKAAEKMFSELGRLKFIKKKNPNLILAVGGCVSLQEQKNIFQRAPYVDIVFGPQTLHHLPAMYEKARTEKTHVIDIAECKIEKFDYFPAPTTTGPTANVTIMEGCNKFCSYCIVPYTRGREISRPIKDIMAEINILAQQGAKEIQLLGQNVNAYRDPNQNFTFSTLIHEVAKIAAIKRIRFTTSHPAEFSDDLIAAFKNEPKLANHLHLPMQSGSDRILKLMRRNYTHEDYQEIIVKLRKVKPNISISTDFIVGFPSETAEDFAQTMQALQKINFDSAFSFIYSPRPNTKAAKMADNVDLAEKKQRLLVLQNQIAVQTRKYNQSLVGTNQQVLVTNNAKKNPEHFSGRTDNNRIVNFAAPENILGEIVTVKITTALPNSLLGELVK